MVVHHKIMASLPRKGGFMAMARLLTLFSPTQAYACTSVTYPTIKVYGVVNVDITGVTAVSTTAEDGVYKPGKTHTHRRKQNQLTL